MEDRIRRLYEMFLRVLSFMNSNAADFAGIPFVTDTVAAIQAETDRLRDLGAAKISKTADSRSSTVARGDARDDLRDDLDYISAVWRTMPDETAGMENKFRRVRSPNDQTLVAAANSFADEALKPDIAPIFASRGIDADFFNALREKGAALARAIDVSASKRGERVGTNAAFTEPARRAKRAVDKLSPIVKHKYRTNPQKLAEWTVASHVERAPRRRDPPPPPPPAQPTGTEPNED
ncbi:MAG: hypothetical protein KIS76_06175 [Pyrinomonadaceae bacterium]|nr:hypothetical protein [Pyrinomonadaceae bacterium]